MVAKILMYHNGSITNPIVAGKHISHVNILGSLIAGI